MWYHWLLGIVSFFIILILLTSLICFFMTFYSPKRKKLKDGEYDLPPGPVYEPLHESMKIWINEIRTMPHEDVEIQSFDGLTLRGKYFESKKGAPIEIMIHGYKGNAERDMNAGVKRAFKVGRNALLIDQRGSGFSDGHVITFGIKERKDCLKWIEFVINKFGQDTRIVLTGISMGAATVLMTAGEELPKNVISVLADCSFTSSKEIMYKIIKEMKLPPKIFYTFIKLGALLFGGFKLEETSPIEAVKKCKIPVIFLHGSKDDFVPCYMSENLSKACSSKNKLVIIPEAGHGLAYPMNMDLYVNKVKEFQKECNE